MALVPVINAAIGLVRTYYTNQVGQQVMRDLRDRLYSHPQTLSLSFFTATKTGEIQSRLQNDVGGVESVVTTAASTILANLVTFASSIAATIIIWPRSTPPPPTWSYPSHGEGSSGKPAHRIHVNQDGLLRLVLSGQVDHASLPCLQHEKTFSSRVYAGQKGFRSSAQWRPDRAYVNAFAVKRMLAGGVYNMFEVVSLAAEGPA